MVETVRSHTMGANSFEMNVMSPESARLRDSAFFIARRLGTISPNTSVK